MKRMMPALIAVLWLAGCAPAQSTLQSTAASEEPQVTAETPGPTATPEPTATSEPGLAYDEIRMIACENNDQPPELYEGYYTMSRDGLWGLMRADGTEVLPCEALSPVSVCGALGQWHWDVYKNWDELDAISRDLTAAGDGALCGAHGGAIHSFYYDLDSPGRDTTAVDLSALRYLQGGTPAWAVPMEEACWERFGDILPVYSAHEDPEGGAEMGWPDSMVTSQRGDGQTVKWWYICRDGSALYPANLDLAGWFFDEALAPVQIEGKWGYLDRNGELVTEAVYDPVCSDAFWEAEEEPVYGAHLRNGYAVVRRGDGWGLLDATGTEVIPCEEQGVAWEGTTLWIENETGWHKTELPA